MRENMAKLILGYEAWRDTMTAGLPWEPGALPTRGQLARLSVECLLPEERERLGQR